jgi:hypothetical protein
VPLPPERARPPLAWPAVGGLRAEERMLVRLVVCQLPAERPSALDGVAGGEPGRQKQREGETRGGERRRPRGASPGAREGGLRVRSLTGQPRDP